MSDTHRIYVACLASYNSGTLHGKWFDLEDYSDAEELREAVFEQVLKTSPCPNVTSEDEDGSTFRHAEEWAIHDFEGFGGYRVSEYESFDTLYELVELFASLDYAPADVVVEFMEDLGYKPEDTERAFQDAYCGTADDWGDYAREYADSCGFFDNASEALRMYFDFDAFGRDLSMEMHGIEHGGQLWIFNNC